MVIQLTDNFSPARAAKEMGQICSGALGYTQPVEVKPWPYGQTPEAIHTTTHPEPPGTVHRLTTENKRDMSGDAYTEATKPAGTFAQCTLATVRNLYRDSTFTIQRLALNCISKDFPTDVRFPDWPKLITPRLNEGEVLRTGNWRDVPQQHFDDIRLAVSSSYHPPHVVIFIRDEAGHYRLYDNESDARTREEWTEIYPHTIARHRADHQLYAIINDSSPLNGILRDPWRLGPRGQPQRRRNPLWIWTDNRWTRADAQPAPERHDGGLADEWSAQFN
jgi:hypothetical protein